jgi:rSAM/selenodomain-associated transferase 2
MKARQRISAIVPALDEELQLPACIERLRRAGACEVVVVDGGSSDRTPQLAAGLADVLLEERGGLFAQLNRGAAAASGDVLLFHYADGLFPEDGLEAIRAALADPRAAGGAFCLRFSSRGLIYRLIAFGAGVRNRLGFGPFGDQSIFARRELFLAAGGFDVEAPLADLLLVKSLRRLGRFRLLHRCVESSVRRWEREGVWRTLAAHWRLSAAYLLGGERAASAAQQELRRLRRVR